MIASYDSIMKPPYDLTTPILKLITSVAEKIGAGNAVYLNKPSPQLRKINRIKTIHSSLKLEGNTLSQDQITAIIENKGVTGPQKDVREVMNAIKTYKNLGSFLPSSSNSFLSAHKMLMEGLIESAGKYRHTNVGIIAGSGIRHVAPPADRVCFLMNNLFDYLKNEDELTIIKSCVFHYEMEFIHPFLDGNGRMGRLWQTVILTSEYAIFEFLPFESVISQNQDDYYRALSACDHSGNSTMFIEFMLHVIDTALSDLLGYTNRTMTAKDRVAYFAELCISPFTRKDYMNVFKEISTATASRDLSYGVKMKIFEKFGEKNRTKYRLATGYNSTDNQ